VEVAFFILLHGLRNGPTTTSLLLLQTPPLLVVFSLAIFKTELYVVEGEYRTLRAVRWLDQENNTIYRVSGFFVEISN